MTLQPVASQGSVDDIPPSVIDGSYLEDHVPFETTLDGGVREALSRYASHVKHIEKGTVVLDGRKRLLCIGENKVIEMATLISVANQVIIKYGKHVTIGQVNAMRFIKEHTSVPVPEVLGFHEDERGYRYIVMNCIKGATLFDLWDSLSAGQRKRFLNQLKGFYDELHTIKGSYIGGIGSLPAEGPLFNRAKNKGPYQDEREMNEAILRGRSGYWKAYGGGPPESFVSCTLPWLPADHDIVLSHGQVCSSHVIVDIETEAVKGIVGWSQAGFYPEYWDCVQAMCSSAWKEEWIQCLPLFLKPFYDEYALWYQINKMK